MEGQNALPVNAGIEGALVVSEQVRVVQAVHALRQLFVEFPWFLHGLFATSSLLPYNQIETV